MKKIKTLLLLILTVAVTQAQDVIYATDIDAGKIRKISANPITGETTGSFSNLESIVSSAALAADNKGWLYFLKYGDSGNGEGDGKVDIYATKADGTGSPVKIANNADINGASNNELGFVRLGVDNNNMVWLLASDGNNKLYLAKFPADGSNPITVTTVSNNINTSDNNNSLFKNGDLAFDGSGTMYALANDDNSNTTKIYTIIPTSVALNGSGVLTYRWTLKKGDGTNFSSRVNGVAFSSTGSMYLSTDGGLYFIDQNTTNFSGIGTVKCSLIKAQTGLTDLATSYWPIGSRLPVKFRNITVKLFNITKIKN